MTAEEARIKAFVMNLDDNISGFYAILDEPTKTIIANYLENNIIPNDVDSGYSPVAIAFIHEVLTAMMNDTGYVLNSDIDPNNSLSFNSFNEFEQHKNNVILENGDVIQNSDGTHSTSFKVKKSLYTFINIIINQNLEDPNTTNQEYVVNNVNTSLSGVTLGASWEQISYDYTIFNNTVVIDLYGALNYDLFIQGIGTVYTEFVHYQMIVDLNTGQAISITSI